MGGGCSARTLQEPLPSGNFPGGSPRRQDFGFIPRQRRKKAPRRPGFDCDGGRPSARSASRRRPRRSRSGRRPETCSAPRTWAPWPGGAAASSTCHRSFPCRQSGPDGRRAASTVREVCASMHGRATPLPRHRSGGDRRHRAGGRHPVGLQQPGQAVGAGRCPAGARTTTSTTSPRDDDLDDEPRPAAGDLLPLHGPGQAGPRTPGRGEGVGPVQQPGCGRRRVLPLHRPTELGRLRPLLRTPAGDQRAPALCPRPDGHGRHPIQRGHAAGCSGARAADARVGHAPPERGGLRPRQGGVGRGGARSPARRRVRRATSPTATRPSTRRTGGRPPVRPRRASPARSTRSGSSTSGSEAPAVGA